MDLRKLSPSQLDALIEKARKRKAALDSGRIARARRRIDAILKDAGLTLAQVYPGGAARAAKSKSDRKPGPKSGRTFTVKPKYRNPADPSQTWAGRGIQPKWYREAIAAGRTEAELRIAD